MTFSIGELSENETEAAVALWDQAGLLRPWNDPRADIKLAMGSPASTILAGREEGVLVATVMVGFDGHRGWIYYLAVAPNLTGAGRGGRMVRAAEDWLKARGAPKLNLLVRAENKGVIAFYEKLGYRETNIAFLQRVLD